MFLKVIFNLILTYNLCLYAATHYEETDAQKIASIRATTFNPPLNITEQSFWDEMIEANLQIAEGTRAAHQTPSQGEESSESQESIRKKALENAIHQKDFFSRARELFEQLEIQEFKVRHSAQN